MKTTQLQEDGEVLNKVLFQKGIIYSLSFSICLLFLLSFSSALICDPTIQNGCPSESLSNKYYNNSYTTVNNTYINQTVNATVNTTQFDSNNPIHIKESWLSSFISSSVDLSNYWKNDGSSEATDNWDLGSYSFTAFDIISNGGAFQGGQYSITDDGILQFYDNGISDVGLIDFINGVFNFDKNVIAPNLCYSNGTNCVTYPTNWTNVSANYLKLDQTIPQTFTNLGTVSTEDILSASLPLGGSVTDKRGVKFLTKTSSSIVQIKKIGNANPTIAYLMDSSFSQLANATFVGNVATFDYDLANNTYYYAVADKGGSAYTQGYSSTVAYPVSGTNVDFITGYAGGDTASYYLNINSITTNTPGTGNGFLKITNGTLDADTGVFILDQSTPQTVTGTPIFSGGLLAGDKIKLTQTDGDEFIDSLADGYVDIYATLGIRTNRRLYIPGFTTTSSLALGTLEFQNYGLGNSWFGDNIYYDGTVFRRRATGSAGMFYFQSNEGQFRFFPSGTAGTDPGTGGNYVQMKTSSSGQWGVGGATGSAINTVSGSFTGAQLYKNANGDVGIGTITPTYKLHVIGNASFQKTDINGTANITDNLYVGNLTTLNNVVVTGNLSAKRPYGMFTSTETQTIAVADTAYPITFNHTEDAYLVYDGDGANISIGQTGDYKIDISAIVVTDTNNKHVEIWVQKWNGTWNNIPRSNTRVEIENAGTEQVVAVPFIIDYHSGEKFRFMWASDDAGSQLLYTTNTSYSPEVPSVIITVYKLSELTE